MRLLTWEGVEGRRRGSGIKIDRRAFSWVRGDLLLDIARIVYHFPLHHHRINGSQASVTMLIGTSLNQ